MTIDLFHLLVSNMKLDPHAFTDQVIVVTGAGRGIGYHTARAFALLGGKLVLAELSEDGKAAEKSIREEGGTALFIQTDVSNPESVNHLLEGVHQAYGQVDVLVNNAILIRQARVMVMSVEIWDRTMAVNLRGTFLTCRAFLPEMLAKNQGVILNMVSTDAMPGLSAYIASKAGITAFSQSLALELEGTGVRVIPFGPGMVDTPGIRSVASGLAPQLDLTESQFLNLSLHADYDGLMPPEHAGAAAAYLTVRLADEFHGQIVNGYEVLERASILQPGNVSLPEIHALTMNSDTSAHDLFVKLTQILAETEQEFGKLPVFVRPLAKGGFKNKTGMTLPDWQRLAASLATGDTPAPTNFVERLAALAKYFRDVPKETGRFTKDQATLQMVAETAQSRLEIIQGLMAKLS